MRRIVCATVVVLAACGGGGGSSGMSVTFPSSGFYTAVYRPQGIQAAGLSLIHPSTPTVEYVISPPTGPIRTPTILYSATTSGNIETREPNYLVYVQDGNLLELPLLANGSKPATSFLALNACSIQGFVVFTLAPQTSQVVVTTRGGDNTCGTADDGQIRVTLASPLSASTIQNIGYRYLGFINSGTSSQHNVWLESDANGVLYTDSGTPQVLRGTNGPVPVSVGGSRFSLVMEDNNQLAVVFFSASAGQWQINPVTDTTGTGWKATSDPSSYYAYLNSGSGNTATWELVAFPLQGGSSTVLDSGSGTIHSATLGTNKIFVSVLGTSATNTLVLVNKNGTGSTVVDTTTEPIRDQVFTLFGMEDILWREALNSNGGLVSTELSTIDEAGAIAPLAAAAYPIVRVNPLAIPLDGSTGPSLLTYTEGFSTATDFSGAQLKTFNSTTDSVIVNGVLPGSSVYGTARVSWLPGSNFGSEQGLFVSTRDQSGYQSAGSRIYTYDPKQANSFTLTTTQQ